MLTPEEYRSATDFLYRTREDWDNVPPDLQEIAKKFLAEIYKYEDYNHDGYEDTLYRGIPPTEFQNIIEYKSWGKKILDGTYTQKEVERAALLYDFLDGATCFIKNL